MMRLAVVILCLMALPAAAQQMPAAPTRTAFLLVDYQPTTEMMVIDFAEKIAKHLPQGVALHSLKLQETATSYAEWFASDN